MLFRSCNKTPIYATVPATTGLIYVYLTASKTLFFTATAPTEPPVGAPVYNTYYYLGCLYMTSPRNIPYSWSVGSYYNQESQSFSTPVVYTTQQINLPYFVAAKERDITYAQQGNYTASWSGNVCRHAGGSGQWCSRDYYDSAIYFPPSATTLTSNLAYFKANMSTVVACPTSIPVGFANFTFSVTVNRGRAWWNSVPCPCWCGNGHWSCGNSGPWDSGSQSSIVYTITIT